MVIANKARVVALMALTVAAEHDMVDPLQTAACLILATNEDLVLHNSPYLLPFPDR